MLPHLSVADNIALPLLLLGWRERAAIDTCVAELLAEVDLVGWALRRPRELSAASSSRVAALGANARR